MAARVVLVNDVYYVAFDQTGDFVIRIKCKSISHAQSVADAFNLNYA